MMLQIVLDDRFFGNWAIVGVVGTILIVFVLFIAQITKKRAGDKRSNKKNLENTMRIFASERGKYSGITTDNLKMLSQKIQPENFAYASFVPLRSEYIFDNEKNIIKGMVDEDICFDFHINNEQTFIVYSLPYFSHDYFCLRVGDTKPLVQHNRLRFCVNDGILNVSFYE